MFSISGVGRLTSNTTQGSFQLKKKIMSLNEFEPFNCGLKSEDSTKNVFSKPKVNNFLEESKKDISGKSDTS
jgi:hypothetical protein